MTFHEATGALLALGVTLSEVADALGLKPQTVRGMRAAAGSTSARTPPPDAVWRPALVRLARERARALNALARTME